MGDRKERRRQEWQEVRSPRLLLKDCRSAAKDTWMFSSFLPFFFLKGLFLESCTHRRAVFTVKCSPFITRPLVTSPCWMKSLTELQEDKPAFRGINQVHQRQSCRALDGHVGSDGSAAPGSDAGQLPGWQLADSPASFILRAHQRPASRIKRRSWGVENEASHHWLDECSMTSSLPYSARVEMMEWTEGPLGGEQFGCLATWNSVSQTCLFPVVNKIIIMIIISSLCSLLSLFPLSLSFVSPLLCSSLSVYVICLAWWHAALSKNKEKTPFRHHQLERQLDWAKPL